MWPAAFGDQSTGPSYASARIDYMANDKVERLAAKKVSSGNTLRGPLNWAGPQDQYFAAIFLPDNPEPRPRWSPPQLNQRTQRSEEARPEQRQ